MKEKLYKKNYISNFIIRFDFDTKLDEGNYEKILELLTNDYPIIEKLDMQNRNIVNKENTQNSQTFSSNSEIKIRNILYNTERNERIIINSDSILFETLKYSSFSKIKPIIEKIILVLKDDYGIKNFDRIGLRYVNLIKKPVKSKKDIFNWEGYINNKLLFATDFIDIKDILQQIYTLEFRLDSEKDLQCRLQFGIPNRNMPADLMEKIYLIDIDVFTNTMVEQEDILDILNTIHRKNIEVFEKCIEDKLRREMNE